MRELPQKHTCLTLSRSQSLPLLLDFESFAVKLCGISDNLPSQEWVCDIRNDQIFPLKESHSKNALGATTASIIFNDQQDNQSLGQALYRADLSETPDNGLTRADLEQMVTQMTQIINEQKRNNPFDLCRRGALYKKLGYLSQALEDLNAVRFEYLNKLLQFDFSLRFVQ